LPKRCVATAVGNDDDDALIPAEHEPYYVYAPGFFPSQVCINNLGGVLETNKYLRTPAPDGTPATYPDGWPVY
jgi:hypothetical protein